MYDIICLCLQLSALTVNGGDSLDVQMSNSHSTSAFPTSPVIPMSPTYPFSAALPLCPSPSPLPVTVVELTNRAMVRFLLKHMHATFNRLSEIIHSKTTQKVPLPGCPGGTVPCVLLTFSSLWCKCLPVLTYYFYTHTRNLLAFT